MLANALAFIAGISLTVIVLLAWSVSLNGLADLDADEAEDDDATA